MVSQHHSPATANMLRSKSKPSSPLLDDDLKSQKKPWYKSLWKRLKGKSSSNSKEVDKLIKPTRSKSRRVSKKEKQAAMTVERVIAEWREQQEQAKLNPDVTITLPQQPPQERTQQLQLSDQPPLVQQVTDALKSSPIAQENVTKPQVQPEKQKEEQPAEQQQQLKSAEPEQQTAPTPRRRQHSHRQAGAPQKPQSRPKSQLVAAGPGAATTGQSSIKRKAAASFRRQQSLRTDASMKISKEKLKYFAVQPLHLREKLQRWCSVTDFRNPQPPPKVNTPSPSRQGSICESLASLQDWQTFAYKMASKRRTML